MAQRAIRTTLPDGRTALNNIIDKYTGESIQLVKIDALPGGVSADGIIYFETITSEYGTEYWVRAEYLTSGVANVKWFGAKGDGVTNDTAAIQTALNTSDGVSIPQGTYMISTGTNPTGGRGLSLRDNNSLRLHNLATLKAMPTDLGRHYVLDLDNVHNVVISGGKIDGNRSSHTAVSGEWGHGINLWSAHNVLIRDISIIGCWGDGIYVGGRDGTFDDPITSEDEADPSTDITIDGVYIDNSRRQGISVTCAQRLILQDSVLSNSNGVAPQALIDIEPNRRAPENPTQDRFGYCRDIVIRNTEFKNGAATGIVTYHLDPASSTAINDITIEGCYFHDNQSTNLVVRRATNVTIRNNIFKPSADSGSGGQVSFSGTDIVFEGNFIEKGTDGIFLLRTYSEVLPVSVQIRRNVISGGGSNNVLMRMEGEISNILFDSNIVDGTWGMLVGMSLGSVLSDTTILNNQFNGVISDILQSAASSNYENISVVGNYFGPGLARVLIRANNAGYLLKDNLFKGQTTRLIDVAQATSGSLINNTFIGLSGDYSVYITQTSNFLVRGNSFRGCDNTAVIWGSGSNTDVEVSNNTIAAGTPLSGTGIQLTGQDYVTINNVVSGYNTNIDISSITVASFGNVSDKVPIQANETRPGLVKRASAQANSTASDVAELVTDFNSLVAKLRSAGLVSTS